jgi:uncharacterized damage-inducible protein DinB
MKPMRLSACVTLLAGALAFAPAPPVYAQHSPSITADLMSDLDQVERKLVSLARAIPADKYDWRPGTGVRSVGEVVLHVTADNYLLPATLGFAADPATGITADDYKTAVAFEQRKMDKDAAVAALQKSFGHLKKSLSATPAEKLGDSVNLFGQPVTTQRAWVLATTHLHEHLGQLIAYARTNGVKPPWS